LSYVLPQSGEEVARLIPKLVRLIKVEADSHGFKLSVDSLTFYCPNKCVDLGTKFIKFGAKCEVEFCNAGRITERDG